MEKNWRTKAEKKVGQPYRRCFSPLRCDLSFLSLSLSPFFAFQKYSNRQRDRVMKLKPQKQHQKEYSGNATVCEKCEKRTATTQQTSKSRN